MTCTSESKMRRFSLCSSQKSFWYNCIIVLISNPNTGTWCVCLRELSLKENLPNLANSKSEFEVIND